VRHLEGEQPRGIAAEDRAAFGVVKPRRPFDKAD
jgi:hypothetical protein